MNHSSSFDLILPVACYIGLTYLLALYCNQRLRSSAAFLEEYYVGGRSLGGFVLAMTLVATYTSASSFIGGPGIAYTRGLGWVLLAMIQVPAAWLTLGVLGKKFAIVARRVRAVTVNGFLKARYESQAVATLASFGLLAFFLAAMTAQFVGGARLFQVITGLPYHWGLFIFAGTVVLYTTVGGFRAVALTDAIQGVVMVVGTLVLFCSILQAGDGMTAIMERLRAIDPALLTPFGPGHSISKPFILSFWVLVCFGVIGLPHTAVRCMGYRDSKAMHRAIIIGTFVMTFILLGMHLSGALGRAVLPELDQPDLIMPLLSVAVLPPVVAGLFLAAPLASVMSTIDSQLIQMSATLVEDVWLSLMKRRADEKQLRRLGMWSTAILGIIVLLAALRPPSLIVWLNLFAFGGMEATFLWPFVLGLYWRRANAAGALASILCGNICYFWMGTGLKSFLGLNVIVPTLLVSLATFIVVSLVTTRPSRQVEETFWHSGS